MDPVGACEFQDEGSGGAAHHMQDPPDWWSFLRSINPFQIEAAIDPAKHLRKVEQGGRRDVTSRFIPSCQQSAGGHVPKSAGHILLVWRVGIEGKREHLSGKACAGAACPKVLDNVKTARSTVQREMVSAR